MMDEVKALLRSPRSLLLISLFAALSFNNWVLGFLFNPRLMDHAGSVSEFSVPSQPHSWVFRFLDIVSGALFLVLASLFLKFLASGRGRNLLIFATTLLGASNIFDAILPLKCSETLSASCSVPVSISWTHLILPSHAYSSILIGITYFVLPLAGLIYADHLKISTLKIVSTISVAIAVLSFLSVVITYISDHSFTTRALGPSQEFQMLIIGVWFVVCCMYAHKELAAETNR